MVKPNGVINNLQLKWYKPGDLFWQPFLKKIFQFGDKQEMDSQVTDIYTILTTASPRLSGFFLERGSQLGISFFPFLHVFDLKALSFWKPTLKCYCIAASTNSMLLLRRCFLLSTLTENMNDDLTTTGWWWNQFFYFFFFFCW